MIKLFKKIYNKIIDIINYDPVTNCKVFREQGCCYVDGFLCDPKTCTEFVMVNERKKLV